LVIVTYLGTFLLWLPFLPINLGQYLTRGQFNLK
jgi:hypothetical protein